MLRMLPYSLRSALNGANPEIGILNKGSVHLTLYASLYRLYVCLLVRARACACAARRFRVDVLMWASAHVWVCGCVGV